MTSLQPKTRLEGTDLKKKVDELMKQGEGFSACARETGYVNKGPNGNDIPAASQFSRALLDSLGYKFASSGGAGGGRARDGKVRVMGAGNAIIAKGYAREAEIQPGDTLKIEVADDGTITLTKQEQKPVLETLREPVADDWEPQQSF
jgi:bifunctional DNA-binding transcriptional regulator/antitoxin component of YhaV-PrlF toxin-antitoxin module